MDKKTMIKIRLLFSLSGILIILGLAGVQAKFMLGMGFVLMSFGFYLHNKVHRE